MFEFEPAQSQLKVADEKQFLALGPGFLLYDEIDREKAKLEIGIALTKIRWQRMGYDPTEIKRYHSTEELAEEEQVEKEVYLQRKVFNEERNRLDLGLMKCTFL